MTGRTGVEEFGACTNMTGSGTGYSSSMFQCNDSEAILTYYESDTCISGDEDKSGVVSNITCSEDNRISRCKTGGEGEWQTLLHTYIIHGWFMPCTRGFRHGRLTPGCSSALACNGRGCRKIEAAKRDSTVPRGALRIFHGWVTCSRGDLPASYVLRVHPVLILTWRISPP